MLNGWGKRGYNVEYTFAAQQQIADRVSLNGGYYRRSFGNQTFTDDLRYDASSYDSFCINVPADPDLQYGNGQGYQVCGVQDLKPTVFAQNLDGSEPESFGPGREVRLTWDPHHTFVVGKDTPVNGGATLIAGDSDVQRTTGRGDVRGAVNGTLARRSRRRRRRPRLRVH